MMNHDHTDCMPDLLNVWRRKGNPKRGMLSTAYKRFCEIVCGIKKNTYLCIWRTDAKASIKTYLALYKALPFVHFRPALVSVLQNFDRATPFLLPQPVNF